MKKLIDKAEILIERVESERAALAMIRASKSPKPGSKLLLDNDVHALVTGRDDDLFALDFSVDVMTLLDEQGEVPLPPYLEREADEADVEIPDARRFERSDRGGPRFGEILRSSRLGRSDGPRGPQGAR